MGAPAVPEFFGTPTGGAQGPASDDAAWNEYLSGPPAPKPLPPPQAGPTWDTIWSNAVSAGARILNAAGAGAAQGWGARPLGLDADSEAGLKKAGIFNDYEAGHTSFVKTVNEAYWRPAATVADTVARAFPTFFGAASGALGAEAQEVAGPQAEVGHPTTFRGGLAYPLAAGGELAAAAGEGLLGPEFGAGLPGHFLGGAEELATDAAKARSVGALGEGEAGYYGAEPVSPENAQARTEAAQEAGIEPTPPEPPAPDIHALARRIDPETFQQYDTLAFERDQARQRVSALADERVNSPEAIEAQDQIDTIMGRVGGVEARLTNAARDRLTTAQGRLDTILNTDTEEMTAARNSMLDADFAMRDLAPDVSAAYRFAGELMPEKPPEPVQAETAAERPQEAAEAEQAPKPTERAVSRETPPEGAETAPQRTPEEEAGIRAATAAGASPEGVAEVAPANVVGEKAGRPASAGVVRTVEGTGVTVTRGLSEHTEATAIENDLTEGFGDLPEYRRVSMKDQAERAADLIEKDPDHAKAVAMGERAAPSGLLPESVYVAVEKKALAEGDVETLQQLATRSKLSTAATTMGQRIRTLGERNRAASPVDHIREVAEARAAEFSKTRDIVAAKAETVEEIHAELQKAASKADAWAEFLRSVECK